MLEEELEKFLSSQSLGTFLLDADTESLLSDVQQKRAALRAAEIARADLKADLKKREDELESLRAMLGQIQDLWESHKEQVDAEICAEAEVQREISSLRQSCTQTEKNLLLVQEDAERLQHLQLERETEARRLQEQVAGDAELIEGLLQKLAELDKDHVLLLQFSAADNASLKKIFVELEKCGEAVARSEVALEEARHEEAAERSAQRALASAFVSAAQRRDELLLKWELCLGRLAEKGMEQKAIIQNILDLKDKIKETEKSEKEEGKFLERLQSSCKALERQLIKKRKHSSQLYQEIHETEATKLELSAQEAGLQTALKRTIEEEHAIRKEIEQERQDLHEKELHLKKLKSNIEKAEQRLALNSELLDNTNSEAKLLEATIEANERELHEIQVKKERAATRLQQSQAELQATVEAEKTQLGEIEALKCHIKKTARQCKVSSANIERLKELCYNQQSELQSLKQRIYDLTHDDNNNEEVVNKQKQIKGLEADLQSTEATIKNLKRQNSSLEGQLTTGSLDVRKKEKDLSAVTEDLLAVQMAGDNCEREKRRLTNESEATAVQYTLQQLQLRQRQAEVQRIRSAAQQLDASRVQMGALIEEQCQDVRAKIQEREKELRNLEQTLHDETLKLHHSSTRLSQLQNRYAEIRSFLGAEKEEETEVTAARAIMKVEQDAQGLQEAEDLVEEAVQEASEDLEALSVLLQEARREGDHLRHHLHSVITQGAEERPRLELEAEVLQIQTQILECRKKRSCIQEELQRARTRLQEVELQLRAVEDLLSEKSGHVKAVERELVEQQRKITHARDALASLLRRTRHHAQMHSDIELRVTQESLRLVNQHLGRLANDNPDAAAAIVLYCQQANIPPPRLSSLARDKAFGSRSSLSGSSSCSSSRGSGDGRSDVVSTHRSLDSGSGSIVGSPKKKSGRQRTSSGKQTSKITINEIKAELPASSTTGGGWPQPSLKGRALRLPPSSHR